MPKLTADEKECPYCAETIKSKAKLCRYCNSNLEHEVIFDQLESVEKIHQIKTCENQQDTQLDDYSGEWEKIVGISPDIFESTKKLEVQTIQHDENSSDSSKVIEEKDVEDRSPQHAIKLGSTGIETEFKNQNLDIESISAFKSPARLSLTLQVLFAVNIILSILQILVNDQCVGLVREAHSSGNEIDLASTSVAPAIAALGLGSIALYIVTGIAFVLWLGKMRNNLEYLNVSEIKSRDWQCFWSFLIPVYALYKPRGIAQEIWKASDDRFVSETGWKSSKSSWLINWWWFFWLLYCLASRCYNSIDNAASDGKIPIEQSLIASTITDSIGILTALLAFFVVRNMTKRQLSKRNEIESLWNSIFQCRDCKNEVAKNDKFCQKCGNRIEFSERQQEFLYSPVTSEDKQPFVFDVIKNLRPVIATLSIPLLILNTLGGIVSGVWLAILGKWSMIGYGLAVGVLAPMFMGFVLMPNLLLAGISLNFKDQKPILAIIFGALAQLYTTVLITLWCVWSFEHFYSTANGDYKIPALIWSYGIASGPWTYMASKERENISTVFSATATQMACLFLLVACMLFKWDFFSAVLIIGAVMSVNWIISIMLASAMIFEERKYIS